MNKFTLLILLVLIGFTTYGQSKYMDSLWQEVETAENDTLKYKALLEVFFEYENSDRNAALRPALQLIEYAKSFSYPGRLGDAYRYLGRNYLYLAKTDSAIYYAELSNAQYASSDSLYMIYNLSNIALAHQRSNDYEKASDFYIKVIDQSRSMGDYYSAVIGLINIASVQLDQENYKSALSYLNQVDEVYESIDKNDEASIKSIVDLYPNVYLNKGVAFEGMDQWDEAIVQYEKTIESCQNLDSEYNATYITAYANNSIGEIYLDYANENQSIENSRANWSLAEHNFQKAYDAFESIQNERGMVAPLNSLGIIKTNLNYLSEGKELLEEGLGMAYDQGFTEEIRDAYNGLSLNAKESNDFKQALVYKDSAIVYRDLIRNEEREQVLQEENVKYETAQKEKENQELKFEAELQQRREQTQRLLFGLGLLGTLLGFGFFYQRYRVNQERKAAEYEKEVSEAMNLFVPNEFIKAIGRPNILDVQLGDQIEKEVTVVFTDIRSFTTISEGMTPNENFQFVKEYAERMGPIIRKNGGFVSQYLGDGIMAIFQNSPQDALNACIEMQEEVENFNKTLTQFSWAPIKVGMGMHTGSLIMGIIGDDHRRDATLISDTVNSSARLESTTKKYGVKILLSEDSKNALTDPDNYHLRYIGAVSVKGKTKPMLIYECMNADEASLLESKLENQEQYDIAVKYLLDQDKENYISTLKEIQKRSPNDFAIQTLIAES